MLKEKLRSQVLGGCLQDFKDHLSGNYKGFYITLNACAGRYIFTVNAYSPNDAGNQQLNTYLQQQKERVKQILDVQTYAYCVVLTIKIPNLAKKIPTAVNELMDPVIHYLMSYNYVSGCENCGSTIEHLDCYEINGRHHYLCGNCTNEIHADLKENQQNIQAQKSNLIPGLIGALLGSLIGCVVWILIYKLGYIAGIAGAVTGICAMKGYEMLGKHLDKKGVIGSVIVMFVMIYFANRIAWTWEAYDVLKEYGAGFFDVYRGLGEIISESDLTANYYGDLAIGYVLTIVCSFREIMNTFRASTGSFTMKKEK